MAKLNPIDRLEVIALMDNISDPFTESHKGMRWNEAEYRFGINMHRELSGKDMCRACNGLSLLITLHKGDQNFKLLFDTGPDDGLVIENAERLDVSLRDVDAIVISHGHNDHYGGLLSVLDHINQPEIPVYVHPELFAPRATTMKNGEKILDTGLITPEDIAAHNGKVFEYDQPISILEDCALISGEVPRHTPYEKGVPNALRQVDGKWEEDSQIIDERILVFNLKDKGLCVFTGCGHTGVVNAANHAIELLADPNIHMIMGGFHLAGPTFQIRIDDTLSDLKKINPAYVVTGHCTGRLAQTKLTDLFEDRHIPYGVGTYFDFK